MLTVAIQAGGESRRMGQDKGLVSFLGKPLILHVMRRLEPIADEVIVTTNRPQDYQFLGVPLYPDLVPGRGALGGLFTALSAAQQPLVAVVACDMPFVCADLLAAQRDALLDQQADIAIPRLEGGLEPFHSVYRRETCLPHIQTAMQADKWRVDAWFSRVKLCFFSKDQVLTYAPDLLCFSNVNTPDELATAEQIARQRGDE
ncbi:MAG: molybdenum cofactor guanylyltransferase [Anaerolineales bacterium]|nr:molybdenum cofactor guanylyltransferase [Anaerolineales bacterium]